jgi:hypothetical protein
VLAYAQDFGSEPFRTFVTTHQRKLHELLEDAREWKNAKAEAAEERATDWELVRRLAAQECACPGGLCRWWEAADEFLKKNAGTIDRKWLAACLARIIQHGPSKHVRVPTIIGPTNAIKSTIMNAIEDVYGYKSVMHRPSETATMALANLVKQKQKKKFIYWDDFRPVEYAVRGTVPVGTFLTLFGGQYLEIKVSQSSQSGYPDIKWDRGAAITAKEEGLWDPCYNVGPGMMAVTHEDVKHMQSRCEVFRATATLATDQFAEVPKCGPSFSRYVVLESLAFAAEKGPCPAPRELQGRKMPSLAQGAAAAWAAVRAASAVQAGAAADVDEEPAIAAVRAAEPMRNAGLDDADDVFAGQDEDESAQADPYG